MRTDNELLPAAIAELNNYRPSSEAERVAAEEWRNEHRRDAYLYRRDSYERAAIERTPHALHPADAGGGCRAAAAGTGGTEHCVMDDYDSGPDWRQAEEIEEQRWHEEHGNDEH